MTEYIKKSDAEAALLDLRKGYRRVDERCAIDGCRLEIKDLPAEDVVLRGVLEQVMWERDIAIGQLESYGVSLGEKADVTKVVHGKWVKDEKASENHIEAIYVCSACQNCEAWGATEKTNYCPNCGAKMDGDSNGQN